MDLSAFASAQGTHERTREEIFKKENHRVAKARVKQAARELLLAQASDWAVHFARRQSPDYARRRVKTICSASSRCTTS